jgi:hypothetical protein
MGTKARRDFQLKLQLLDNKTRAKLSRLDAPGKFLIVPVTKKIGSEVTPKTEHVNYVQLII